MFTDKPYLNMWLLIYRPILYKRKKAPLRQIISHFSDKNLQLNVIFAIIRQKTAFSGASAGLIEKHAQIGHNHSVWETNSVSIASAAEWYFIANRKLGTMATTKCSADIFVQNSGSMVYGVHYIHRTICQAQWIHVQWHTWHTCNQKFYARKYRSNHRKCWQWIGYLWSSVSCERSQSAFQWTTDASKFNGCMRSHSTRVRIWFARHQLWPGLFTHHFDCCYTVFAFMRCAERRHIGYKTTYNVRRSFRVDLFFLTIV